MGNMQSATDIFALINKITADGELSQDEVYALGAWLESNPAAKRSWPGSILAKPVIEVLKDGKVTKAELHSLGKLLVSVQSRRTERDNASTKSQTQECVAMSLAQLNLSKPLLPSFAIASTVASEKTRGVQYDVDLSIPVCACPDGVRRSVLSRGHLNRCCKHVFYTYAQLRPRQGWPEWLDGFLAHASPPSIDAHWIVVDTAPRTLIGIHASEWCDVFAPRRTIYDRFSFSYTELRWSYGDRPKNAEQIESEIGIFLKAWSRTEAGKANAVRTQLAREAKERRIMVSVADRKRLLSELCGQDYASMILPHNGDEGLLLTRVLRPINFAISQTFTISELSPDDRRKLQVAIAHAPYLQSLPRYGPTSTWDELDAKGDSEKTLSKELRICVTYTAFQSLSPEVFIALKAKGVSSYKKSLDDYLIKRL